MENKDSRVGLYDDCFNEYVFSEVKKGSVCLDAGCWTGNLGKALIAKKNCVVDGVDRNREALEKARSRGYRKVFLADLNSEDFSLEMKEKYDTIIFADVLEHLADPGRVLKKMHEFLGDGGRIIISVPNVAFALQRLLHLFGRFDYSPRGGIMDENHLRFFTLKSIHHLCRKSEYKVEKSYGYSQVRKRYFFLKALSKIFPEMFAIQLLVIARKSG